MCLGPLYHLPQTKENLYLQSVSEYVEMVGLLYLLISIKSELMLEHVCMTNFGRITQTKRQMSWFWSQTYRGLHHNKAD